MHELRRAELVKAEKAIDKAISDVNKLGPEQDERKGVEVVVGKTRDENNKEKDVIETVDFPKRPKIDDSVLNKITAKLTSFKEEIAKLRGSTRDMAQKYQKAYEQLEKDIDAIATKEVENTHSQEQVKALKNELSRMGKKPLLKDVNQAYMGYVEFGKTKTQELGATYWAQKDSGKKGVKISAKETEGKRLIGKYQEELQSSMLGRKGLFEKGIYKGTDGSYWHKSGTMAASAAATAGLTEFIATSANNKELVNCAKQAFNNGAEHVVLNNPSRNLSDEAAKWQRFFNFRQSAISQYDPAKEYGLSKDALHFKTICQDPELAKMFVQDRNAGPNTDPMSLQSTLDNIAKSSELSATEKNGIIGKLVEATKKAKNVDLDDKTPIENSKPEPPKEGDAPKPGKDDGSEPGENSLSNQNLS